MLDGAPVGSDVSLAVDVAGIADSLASDVALVASSPSGTAATEAAEAQATDGSNASQETYISGDWTGPDNIALQTLTLPTAAASSLPAAPQASSGMTAAGNVILEAATAALETAHGKPMPSVSSDSGGVTEPSVQSLSGSSVGSVVAPEITDLEVYDNGLPGDAVTSSGVISGTTAPFTDVEIDADGDGGTDYYTVSNINGDFSVDVESSLTEGGNTVNARTRVYDPVLEDYVYSTWASVSFTYYENLPPVITEFGWINKGGGFYQLLGTVVDDPDGHATTVVFGGVAAGHNVAIDLVTGKFSIVLPLTPGDVSAQTTDGHGAVSNLAEDLITWP